MICEECKKNQATVHVVHTVNGHRTEKHLCAQCANQNVGAAYFTPFSVSDLITGYFHQVPSNTLPQKRCPGCNMSFADFRSAGRLGCPQCYTTFHDELTPMLQSIHGRCEHRGKAVPEAKGEMDTLSRLQCDLNEAVQQENYEQAAKIRDEIRRLEKQEAEGEDGNVV
ncbi:MAG: UvrB/UvrC motif-containing protein [Christensenellales bacterium]|jgi:protein arginine kinase activator